MKKRLEDEYRQLMQSETPDLWDRIEDGIRNVEQELPEDIIPENIIEEKKNRKRGHYALPIAACIAACICIPLAVTVIFRTGIFRTGILRSTKGENQMADMAAPEMAADMEENSMVTEAIAEEEAGEDDCAVEEKVYGSEDREAGEEEPAADTEAVAITSDEDGTANSSSATEKVSGDTREDSGSDRMTDMTEEKEGLQAAKSLHILEISSATEYTKENGESGVVYQAATSEGGLCTIYVPSAADFTMESGEEYEITVTEGTEDYDYEYAGRAE